MDKILNDSGLSKFWSLCKNHVTQNLSLSSFSYNPNKLYGNPSLTSTQIPSLNGELLTMDNLPTMDIDADFVQEIETNKLAVSHGGTGVGFDPDLLVDLSSTSAVNPFKLNPRPGVMNLLPISHGGTGASSAAEAQQALLVSTLSDGLSGWGYSNASGEGYLIFPICKPRFNLVEFSGNSVSLRSRGNGHTYTVSGSADDILAGVSSQTGDAVIRGGGAQLECLLAPPVVDTIFPDTQHIYYVYLSGCTFTFSD